MQYPEICTRWIYSDIQNQGQMLPERKKKKKKGCEGMGINASPD